MTAASTLSANSAAQPKKRQGGIPRRFFKSKVKDSTNFFEFYCQKLEFSEIGKIENAETIGVITTDCAVHYLDASFYKIILNSLLSVETGLWRLSIESIRTGPFFLTSDPKLTNHHRKSKVNSASGSRSG